MQVFWLQILRSTLLKISLQPLRMWLEQHLNYFARMVLWRNFAFASIRILRLVTVEYYPVYYISHLLLGAHAPARLACSLIHLFYLKMAMQPVHG
ncbi:hypothetical protein DsansV1_C02g0014411 [Dioscorea sansibarensis]